MIHVSHRDMNFIVSRYITNSSICSFASLPDLELGKMMWIGHLEQVNKAENPCIIQTL